MQCSFRTIIQISALYKPSFLDNELYPVRHIYFHQATAYPSPKLVYPICKSGSDFPNNWRWCADNCLKLNYMTTQNKTLKIRPNLHKPERNEAKNSSGYLYSNSTPYCFSLRFFPSPLVANDF